MMEYAMEFIKQLEPKKKVFFLFKVVGMRSSLIFIHSNLQKNVRVVRV